MELNVTIHADTDLLSALKSIADGLNNIGTPFMAAPEKPVAKKSEEKPKLVLAPAPVVEKPEAPTPVVEAPASVAEEPKTRDYTVVEISKAGAKLLDSGVVDQKFFAELMKGKGLTKMSQEELNGVAKVLIEKGAVL